jgi:imidazolonepropionase-like amidohydrolase
VSRGRLARRHASALAGWLAIGTVSAPHVFAQTDGLPGTSGGPPLALVGATLVDGTGRPPVEDAVVVLRAGRIDCAGPRASCPVPAGAIRDDLAGRWLIPGLADGHVHYSQTGWADGRPDQAADLRESFPYELAVAENRANPERWFQAYLCSGVTTTWDVGGYPWTWELAERTDMNPFAPNVSAAGPLVSARDHWLNVPGERQFLFMADTGAVRESSRYLLANRTPALKVWYLVSADSPDTTAFKAMLRVAAEEARAAGTPMIVHATELWTAKDALRAGARHLVHSVQDLPVDEEFLELARRNGATYNPTLTVYVGIGQFRERRFDPSHLELACVDPDTRRKARLTDEVPGAPSAGQLAASRQAGERRYRLMLENLARVHEAGIPVVMGTDAGNTLTLHGPSVHLEMEAMQEAGLSPMDVLVASTRNVALAMGRLDDLGTVEAGKVADLVVLGADPTTDISHVRRIEKVVRAGRLHERSALTFPPG